MQARNVFLTAAVVVIVIICANVCAAEEPRCGVFEWAGEECGEFCAEDGGVSVDGCEGLNAFAAGLDAFELPPLPPLPEWIDECPEDSIGPKSSRLWSSRWPGLSGEDFRFDAVDIGILSPKKFCFRTTSAATTVRIKISRPRGSTNCPTGTFSEHHLELSFEGPPAHGVEYWSTGRAEFRPSGLARGGLIPAGVYVVDVAKVLPASGSRACSTFSISARARLRER